MEHCPKYNFFLKRKKSASEGGGHWEFRFCGFGYFLDRFLFQKYLISDAVFGFSYLTYFGSGFSQI